MYIEEVTLQQKYELILPHLNERQQRLLLAAEAKCCGYGGISKVHRASGVSRVRIHQGIKELTGKPMPDSRSRMPGGGRKKIQAGQPEILNDLDLLIDPMTRGEPESPLRWTCKSTRQLAAVLRGYGYSVSHQTVADLLKDLGYSLQANAKKIEGSSHKDRDAQFHYINDLSKGYINQNCPVVSVDTKKKELVGNYKNHGQEWQPKGEPQAVNVHDFPDKIMGKAIPYGVYDIDKNLGWVNVGIDHDTAEFAVESIKRWWEKMGKPQYDSAPKLLITADSGGSNGRRVKLWKKELQRFANDTGLEITVCHFPPGTSKWNKIEHRLFSYISLNWRGRPLVNYETVVELISSTRTRNGLKVESLLDENKYQTKIKVSAKEMAKVNLHRHSFHGEWNYTIKPAERHNL